MTKPLSKNLIGATSEMMILYVLRQKDSYGYEISKIIFETSEGRINWKAGSLYPVLKKMETKGLIRSKWIIAKNERARKYYTILPKGHKKINEFREDLQLLFTVFERLLVKIEAKPTKVVGEIP